MGTQIDFELNKSGNVKIVIFNQTGLVVKEYNSYHEKGINSVKLNFNNLPSGIYYYTLIINSSRIETKKLIKM